MKRFSLLPLLLVLAAACASSSTGSKLAAVNVRAHSLPFFASGDSAPLELDVYVTNKTAAPLTVRSIRVTSLSMVEYEIISQERLFNETLAPGESKSFPISATAVRTASGQNAVEALSMRAEIDFEHAGGRTREAFTFPHVGT